MNLKLVLFVGGLLIAVSGSGCATKKYARNRINERVTPIEQRTGELEETSRRNTIDISRLSEEVVDVKGRIERAGSKAETALSRAGEADRRAQASAASLGEIRSSLGVYETDYTAIVNFKFDSYELTPDTEEVLDTIAERVKDRSNFIFEIEGFADWTGPDSYNNQLTQKRANAVRRYLAERHNIPLFRMYILGFGESRPVADNRTREGRAQNRRVEVRLLRRNLGGGTTAQSTP